MLSLPPSQGTSCCFTCRIISLLLSQHRGQMALVLWEPWTLVLRTGINPSPGGEGAWLLLKVRRKLVMSPMSWGSALGKGLLFFQGGRHYMMTHDDRFCCCCAVCGAVPSKGSQRCLPSFGHTGTGPWLGFSKRGLLHSRLWLTQKWVWGPREEWILYSEEVQPVWRWDCSSEPPKTRKPDTSSWLVTMSRW